MWFHQLHKVEFTNVLHAKTFRILDQCATLAPESTRKTYDRKTAVLTPWSRYEILFGLYEYFLHVSLHLGEDWSSETRDCIPPLCCDKSGRRTTLFSAKIISRGYISKYRRIIETHLVQQWIDESELLFFVVEHEAVQ